MLRRGVPVFIAVLGSLVLAAPAAAQQDTLAGTYTVPGGSASYSGATTNTSAAEAGSITLAAPRTILDFSSFGVAANDSLNFVFGARSDIAFVRVTGASAASVAGQVNSFIGSTAGARGGNVWVSDGNNVVLAGTAQVRVGGLLATTANVSNTDFLDASDDFAFISAPSTSSVQVASGASVDAADSFVGFVAPSVTQASGSTVEGDASTLTEALWGSASSYNLTTQAQVGGGLDLLTVEPQTGVTGTIELFGSTTASDVFVVSHDSTTTTGALTLGGLSAAGAVVSGSGDVIVSAGQGLSRSAAGNPMDPLPGGGAVAQPVAFTNADTQATRRIRAKVNGPISVQRKLTAGGGLGEVLLEASDDLSISGPNGQVKGRPVSLSTPADFVNTAGATAVDSDHWFIYASDPATTTFGGLNSGRPALWDADIVGRPAYAESGRRYVFKDVKPTLTFSPRDQEKIYGQDKRGSLQYSAVGYHPGVPGAFAKDTAASVFDGRPLLTSPGAAPQAEVDGSPYPIDISAGDLNAKSGYAFAFEEGGTLTVLCSPKVKEGPNGCPGTEPGGQNTPPGLVRPPRTGQPATVTATEAKVGSRFTVPVGGSGVFPVKGATASCAASSPGACAVQVVVSVPRKVMVRGAAAKRVVIGKSKTSVAPSQTKALKGKLSKRGIKTLKKRRKLKATVTITVKDGAGKTAKKTVTATLKAPKKKG